MAVVKLRLVIWLLRQNAESVVLDKRLKFRVMCNVQFLLFSATSVGDYRWI